MPMKVGYEHDTLDGAPDLMDEEVLQEVPDVSCQETDIDFDIASRQKGILIQYVPTMPNIQQNVFTSTVSLFQGPDTEDINPDEIFVLSEEFI